MASREFEDSPEIGKKTVTIVGKVLSARATVPHSVHPSHYVGGRRFGATRPCVLLGIRG